MCTTVAPASYARFASSAISSGVYGTHGHCSRFASTPVRAQVITTLSSRFGIGSFPLEHGFALLEESGDALGSILEHRVDGDQPLQVSERRLERHALLLDQRAPAE